MTYLSDIQINKLQTNNMHISEELQKGVKALMAITVRLNKKTTNPKTNGMQMCNSKLQIIQSRINFSGYMAYRLVNYTIYKGQTLPATLYLW